MKTIYFRPMTEVTTIMIESFMLASSAGTRAVETTGSTQTNLDGMIYDNNVGDDDAGGTLAKRHNSWSGWDNWR